MAEKKLSIDERLDILNEFANFYDEQPASFCRFKWLALVSLREFINSIRDGLTEEELDDVVSRTIASIDTDALGQKYNMGELGQSFFEGGFGLGLGVFRGDKEAIANHRKMMDEINASPILNKREKDKRVLLEIIEEIKDMINND